MFEIDYLSVGEGEKTGDAIALRFTRPDTLANAVVVIDGGFRETGDRLANHIISRYGTTVVDLAVCTHLDDDHVRGLFAIIEQLSVRTLLLHRPSMYGFGPGDGVKAELAEELASVAARRGTKVIAPATGQQYLGGVITVAGPTQDYYMQLLDEEFARHTTQLSAMQILGKTGRSALRSLTSDPGETLVDDNGGTGPRNNASVIVNVAAGGARALFTGDAGVPALAAAADFLDQIGLSAMPLDFFDIPHHSSRHNLDPVILDRLLGTCSTVRRGLAFTSIGKQADEYPRPEIANAIHRRGYPVFCTRGTNVWWGVSAPARPDYTNARPVTWLDETGR